MTEKLMAVIEGLAYEELFFVFLFGIISVAVLTFLAFVLPKTKSHK